MSHIKSSAHDVKLTAIDTLYYTSLMKSVNSKTRKYAPDPGEMGILDTNESVILF